MLSSDGVEYLYTYRDPHLTESYDTFAKARRSWPPAITPKRT